MNTARKVFAAFALSTVIALSGCSLTGGNKSTPAPERKNKMNTTQKKSNNKQMKGNKQNQNKKSNKKM